MSELDAACMKLRRAIRNEVACERYVNRERVVSLVWQNFGKGKIRNSVKWF